MKLFCYPTLKLQLDDPIAFFRLELKLEIACKWPTAHILCYVTAALFRSYLVMMGKTADGTPVWRINFPEEIVGSNPWRMVPYPRSVKSPCKPIAKNLFSSCLWSPCTILSVTGGVSDFLFFFISCVSYKAEKIISYFKWISFFFHLCRALTKPSALYPWIGTIMWSVTTVRLVQAVQLHFLFMGSILGIVWGYKEVSVGHSLSQVIEKYHNLVMYGETHPALCQTYISTCTHRW